MLRTVVMAALAAALLLGLGTGAIAPLPEPGAARWALLYRRAGDTFVRMFCLARVEPDSAAGRRLLESAGRYYQLSERADPSQVEAAASLGLVLHVLNRKQEALLALSRAAAQVQPTSQKRALAALLLLVVSRRPDPMQLEEARGFASELAPGPMTLAFAYDSIGRSDLAEREWDQAERQASRILPALTVMLVTCGLLMCAGVAGLVAMLIGLMRRRTGMREPPPPATWGVREAAEALIWWVLLGAVASALLARLGLLSAGRERDGAVLVAPSLIGGAGAIAWVWAISPRGGGFGWRFGRGWRSVAMGLAAAGVLAPALLVLEQALERAAGPSEHPLVPIFATAADWGSRAALMLAACVIVPALEETLFRGILYRGLHSAWSVAPAAGVSALIFAVGHMSWAGLLPYLLLGLALAWLYERTGSLLAPAVAHGAFNAFNLAILMALFG
jgi:membrane protease YdiL (CAAX protease family)